MDSVPSSVTNFLVEVLLALLGVMPLSSGQTYLLPYKVHHCMPGWASVLGRLCVALHLTRLGSTAAASQLYPQQGILQALWVALNQVSTCRAKPSGQLLMHKPTV